MRTLVTLALGAMLAAIATATPTAPATQGEAQALEDSWPNCSAVIHGRLGALHAFGDDDFKIVGTTDDFWTLTLAPCSSYHNDGVFLSAYNNVTGDEYTFMTAVPNENGKVMQFHMPVGKGDVPLFRGAYLGYRNGGVDDVVGAAVTVKCSVSAGATMFNVTKDGAIVEMHAIEACARFPYTNKGVPAGGVAAIIIVLLCFVIQFGICGWYHKTQAVDENPFTTAGTGGEEYQNVE